MDVVRIHARWWEIAPGEESQSKPAGFDAGNHADPQYNWAVLDNAIAIIRGAGLKVMLTITGPGPLWASTEPAKRNRNWKPDPKAFADFSKAAATRYKADVDRYLIWNEPNQKGWLQPQWEKVSGKFQPVSPHIYRSLVRAAQPVVKAADPGAEVVIGELAPVGNKPISVDTPMRPLAFLRSLGCVDDKYKSIKTGRCKGFKAAKGDTLGYHPHPQKYAPDRVNPDVDAAQFGDLKRLFTAIDKLRARKRISMSKTIHLTEFGYETSPPDPASGISTALQTRYLQQAAYIAWRHQARARPVLLPVGRRADPQPRQRHQALLGLADGPALQRRLAEAGALDDVRAVRDRPGQGRRHRARSGARSAPRRRARCTLDGARARARPSSRTSARYNTRADGVWTRKLKPQAGAAYRYEWTPKPSLLDPNPQPRVSGIIDFAKKEKSRYKAAAALATS